MITYFCNNIMVCTYLRKSYFATDFSGPRTMYELVLQRPR